MPNFERFWFIVGNKVFAYVNHGRVICECARPYCGNAMQLAPRQPTFTCGGNGGCGFVADVVWPSELDDILTALKQRPVPATRNWFPKDHPMAVRAGIPHGQSVRDLVNETREYGGV